MKRNLFCSENKLNKTNKYLMCEVLHDLENLILMFVH